MAKIKSKKLKAFSLLELLISIFIFILVIVTSVSVFTAVIFAREKNREMQRNLEEARTAMETMAKNIRMSTKLEKTGDKITMYNNSQSRCIAYAFDNMNKKLLSKIEIPVNTSDPVCNTTVPADVIIPSNVIGSFDVDKTVTTNPKVIGKATISLTIGVGTSRAQHLQTTVSFRDYQGVLYD